MYGSGDEIRGLNADLEKAMALLVSVAKGEKSQADVQKWLEEHYPEKCPTKRDWN